MEAQASVNHYKTKFKEEEAKTQEAREKAAKTEGEFQVGPFMLNVLNGDAYRRRNGRPRPRSTATNDLRTPETWRKSSACLLASKMRSRIVRRGVFACVLHVCKLLTRG